MQGWEDGLKEARLALMDGCKPRKQSMNLHASDKVTPVINMQVWRHLHTHLDSCDTHKLITDYLGSPSFGERFRALWKISDMIIEASGTAPFAHPVWCYGVKMPLTFASWAALFMEQPLS